MRLSAVVVLAAALFTLQVSEGLPLQELPRSLQQLAEGKANLRHHLQNADCSCSFLDRFQGLCFEEWPNYWSKGLD